MQTMESRSISSTISQLNSFLRGELSAVETYRQALEKIGASTYRVTLQDCLLSHEQRVTRLSDEIRRLGGDPAQSSGTWGAFAKAIEGSAKAFGEKAAIAALEEGEDHGRNDYKRDVNELESSARLVVEREILPEQQRTHDAISALKHSLH
jgi:uncharacterized protein (TIGR02284 family)